MSQQNQLPHQSPYQASQQVAVTELTPQQHLRILIKAEASNADTMEGWRIVMEAVASGSLGNEDINFEIERPGGAMDRFINSLTDDLHRTALYLHLFSIAEAANRIDDRARSIRMLRQRSSEMHEMACAEKCLAIQRMVGHGV